MDISNVGDVIRWPFEILQSIIIFIIKQMIPIIIIGASIYVIYWIFSREIIKKISNRIILMKKEKVKNVQVA